MRLLLLTRQWTVLTLDCMGIPKQQARSLISGRVRRAALPLVPAAVVGAALGCAASAYAYQESHQVHTPASGLCLEEWVTRGGANNWSFINSWYGLGSGNNCNHTQADYAETMHAKASVEVILNNAWVECVAGPNNVDFGHDVSSYAFAQCGRGKTYRAHGWTGWDENNSVSNHLWHNYTEYTNSEVYNY
jgi:hypothetical protein